MKRAYIYLLLLAAVVLPQFTTSCTHEIDFDYPTADPLVVVEGRVTNAEVYVRVSSTRPMSDSVKTHVIDHAAVLLSCDDGTSEQLVYNSDEQCYRSPSGMTGTPGHTYTLSVTVGDRRYEASSYMLPPAPIDTVAFRYYDVLQQRLYLLYIKAVSPTPGEMRNYWYRLLRGGKTFRWGALSDRGCEPGYLERDLICTSEEELKKDQDMSHQRPLRDGDIMQVELMTIDRPTYHYLMSLQSSESTTTNPQTNFSGGALGVFSAAGSVLTEPFVFDRAIITDTIPGQ